MGRAYRERRRERKTANDAGTATDEAPPSASRDFVCNLSGRTEHIALLRQLAAQGFRNDNRLRPAEFRSTGRGIYTTRTVAANDVLIDMPFESLITLATLQSDDGFADLFEPSVKVLGKKLSIQTLLAVYVLYRQHRYPDDPYVRTLPPALTQPLFCNEAELMVLNGDLFERIHTQSQTRAKEYRNLQLAATAMPTCSCCGGAFFANICTPAAFKWAFMVVNSRSVYIDAGAVKRCCVGRRPTIGALLRDSPNTALAPFMDLLNHGDDIDAQQPEFEVKTARYRLATAHSFRPYEQVRISYGPLDNVRLLVDYGFVLAGNRHDCVRLELSDITEYLEEGVLRRERKPIDRNRFKFVKENGLDVEMFVSRADGLSHSLVVVLTCLFVETVAHFSNVLSIVGYGGMLEVAPVAVVARKLLEYKRRQFAMMAQKLVALAEERRTASGGVVVVYAEESVRLLDDVLEEYLKVDG